MGRPLDGNHPIADVFVSEIQVRSKPPAGAESHGHGGIDVDDRACLRIAAPAGRALPGGEGAESRELNTSILFQSVLNCQEKRVDQRFRFSDGCSGGPCHLADYL
jgi:hypothetical protein